MPSAKFLKSAVLPKDFPPDRGVEIAIAGRSNAGKSSLINLLTNHRIAKVSGTPGKTRLLNFFEINGKYTLVDMPGYGYAARAAGEMEEWQRMIETYLMTRDSLRGLVLVMDSRRDWTDDEDLLKKFTDRLGVPMVVVLTKADKLTRNQGASAKAKVVKASGAAAVFLTSTLAKTGHTEMEDWVFQNWVKPALAELAAGPAEGSDDAGGDE